MANIGDVVNYVYGPSDPVAPASLGQTRPGCKVVDVAGDGTTNLMLSVDGLDSGGRYVAWTVWAPQGGAGQQATWF